MPRIGFTVRKVMIGVLSVAVALAGFEAGRGWERERTARVARIIRNRALAEQNRSRANRLAALPALYDAELDVNKLRSEPPPVSAAVPAPQPAGNPLPQPSR